MKQRLLPVLIAVLLVLSGCLGGLNPGVSSSSNERDPANANLPPGVNESGVVNVSTLLTAHNQTLRSKGFIMNTTFYHNLSYGSKNSSSRTVVGPNATRFYIDTQSVSYGPEDAGSPVVERLHTRMWSNSTITFQRRTINSSSENKTYTSEVPSKAIALTNAKYYRSDLKKGAFKIEKVVTRDNHTFTTLVANHTRNEGSEILHARFVIDERGVIHTAITDTRTGQKNKGHAHTESRIVEIGASPERPDWAVNSTSN